MGGIKPVAQDEPDNPFVDVPIAQDELDNPFVDRAPATRYTGPEKKEVSGTWGDAIKGLGRVIAHVPEAIAGLPNDIVGIFNGRGLTKEQKQSSTVKSYLQARLGYTQRDIDEVPTIEERSPGDVAKEGATFLLAIPTMTYQGAKKLATAETMGERGEGLGELLLGGAGLAGAGAVARRGFLKSSGKDAGPAPPGATPTGPSIVGGPTPKGLPPKAKGAPPTPEQVAARQAKVAELKAQGEAVVEGKKAMVRQKQFAARAWNALSADQRKALYPGMADVDYTEAWDNLKDPSKNLVLANTKVPEKKGGASSDAPAARGAGVAPVPAAPVPTAPAGLPATEADPGLAMAQEIAAAPDAAFPAVQAALAAESPYAGLTKGPPLPDVNAIQQQASAEAKAAFERSRQQGIQSGIPTTPAPIDQLAAPTPNAIEQLAASAGITPDEMIERLRTSTPASIEAVAKSKGMPDIDAADPLTPQTVLPTPGEVVGEIKPVKKTRKKKSAITKPEPSTQLITGKPADAGQGLTTTPESIPAPRPEGPPVNTPGSLTVEQIKTAREVVKEFERQIDELDAAFEALGDNPTPEQSKQYSAALFDNVKKKDQAMKLVPGVLEVVRAEEHGVKMPDTLGKELNTIPTRRLLDAKKVIVQQLSDPLVLADHKAILQAELDRIIKFAEAEKRKNEGGFVVNPFQRKAVKKIDEASMTESEKYMDKRVLLEPEMGNPWNWVKMLRRIYMGVMRPSHPFNVAVRLYETTTGEKVGAHEHSGMLQEMMDGSLTKAEGFLRGDGPHWPDGQGGTIPATFPDPATGLPQPVKSLASVIETAGGDVQRFGWLWAATRALELKALKNKNIGIDLGHAQDIFINAPENLHQAVREGRDYHLALAELGAREGLLRPEAVAEFANETAYGPIQRIFDERFMKRVVEEMQIGQKSAATVLGSQPFKTLKGSDLPMLNMVQNSIPVTFRVLRATNINRFALSLVDLARKQPDMFKGIVEPVDYRLSAVIKKEMKLKEEAVKEMFNETGVEISEEHASLFANILVDNAISVDGGVVKVFNQGKVELWRVSSLIAESIKSMTPMEQNWTMRAMGAPAHTLRLGTVLDPLFMANQVLIDQFQGWFNTKYGFRPFYDSFRGWWHLVRESEVAKEAMRAGGVERAGLRTRTGLAEVIAGPSLSPLPLAHEQIITFHPFKAMNALLTPLRESTRMGEYLRARDAGMSPVAAAHAARDLLGNYSVEGTFTTIRALNYISAFGRPALAVTDKTARVIKDNPGRWFFRGMVTLGLGAALLYLANIDDEEIRRIRQTPAGQRWFYFRGPNGKIMKVRKPYGEGAIFASGVEAFMDMQYQKNPDALKLWGESIKQELMINMLPVLGVMAVEAKFNTNWRTGAPIIPRDQMKLDPEYRTGNRATTADRIIGETINASPAMINYVIRGVGGYLGESVVLAVSAAMDWKRTGELPPAEDWPLTQRLFARYPSYGVQPVRHFYENADKVDRAAETVNMVYKDRPDRLMIELNQHGSPMELAPMIEEVNVARQQIADLRRAAEWLDPLQDVGPATKVNYRKSFMEQIIMIAETSNLKIDAMMKANKESRKNSPTNVTIP